MAGQYRACTGPAAPHSLAARPGGSAQPGGPARRPHTAWHIQIQSLTLEKGVKTLRSLTGKLTSLILTGFSMVQRSQVQGVATDSKQKVGVQSGRIYTP